MRSLWIGMTILVLVGLCGAVSAQVPQLDPEGPIWWNPVQSPELFVYNVNDDGTLGEQARLARAWKTGGYQSYCNKDRCVDVQIYASVAQWMKLYFEATDLHWRVLKPGTYAVDGIAFHLGSNGDVGVTFTGFDNLKNTEAPADEIETWYTANLLGAPAPGPNDWVPAAALNRLQLTIPEDQTHTDYSYQLWNKIKVIPCDSACEYRNDGRICFRLLEQKPWVDRELGDFRTGFPLPDNQTP